MKVKSIDEYKQEMLNLYRASGQDKITPAVANLSPNETAPTPQNPAPLNPPTPPNQTIPDEQGGLLVWVTTLRNLYAVANAQVTIRNDQTGEVIDAATTDLSGRTKVFILPAPPKNFSDDPNGTNRPYSLYNVNVKADGYVEQNALNVPVFPTITSVQPVDMILNSASNNSGEAV